MTDATKLKNLRRKRDLLAKRRQYREAERVDREIESLKSSILNQEFQDRKSGLCATRQEREIEFLNAFRDMKEKWSSKLAEVEEETIRLRKNLKKKHHEALKKYHDKIVQDIAKVGPKYSKKVHDMRVTRDNLAKARRYREAHDLDIAIRKLEILENSKYKDKVAADIATKMKLFREKLGKKTKVFETKRSRMRRLLVNNRQDEIDEFNKRRNVSVKEMRLQSMKKRKVHVYGKILKNNREKKLDMVSKPLYEFQENQDMQLKSPGKYVSASKLGFGSSEDRFETYCTRDGTKRLAEKRRQEQIMADTKALAEELQGVFDLITKK